MTEHCKRCKSDLPKINFFKDNKYWKQCIPCCEKKLVSRKLWLADTGKEYMKNYSEKYAPKARENTRKSKLLHPETSKLYHIKNRDELNRKKRIYGNNNKEKEKIRTSKWRQENASRLQCPECDYATSDQSTLDNHIASMHTDEKNIKCEKCDYTCAIQALLNKHMTNAHDKKYECDDCKELFGNLGNLKRHWEAIHDKTKSYKCPNCKFKTSTNDGLSVHLKRCSGDIHCSRGEFAIMKVLDTMGLTYDFNTTYELKDIHLLRWDFIIHTDDEPIFIEFDGLGHFQSVCFGGMSPEKAQIVFETCQRHDKLKNEYCRDKGYLLLRINDSQFANIHSIVKDFMESNTI
jgi:hypothetical protein